MSDVAGGVLGWVLGERWRAHLLERRYGRMVAGRDVAVGALAHFVGAPEWRDTAGGPPPSRRAGYLGPEALGTSDLLHTVVPPRRWKPTVLALGTSNVVGTRSRPSAARADPVLIELAAVPEIIKKGVARVECHGGRELRPQPRRGPDGTPPGRDRSYLANWWTTVPAPRIPYVPVVSVKTVKAVPPGANSGAYGVSTVTVPTQGTSKLCAPPGE